MNILDFDLAFVACNFFNWWRCD